MRNRKGVGVSTRVPINEAHQLAAKRAENLNLSLAEIGLSVRTLNCLEEFGVLTVRDVLGKRREELLVIPNFGEKTLDEIYTALAKIGFVRKKCSA